MAKPAPETMTARAAQKLGGLSYVNLLRSVALGKVRVEALPGEPLRYYREDIEKVAFEKGRQAK